jgi:hypothetical protein
VLVDTQGEQFVEGQIELVQSRVNVVVLIISDILVVVLVKVAQVEAVGHESEQLDGVQL